MSSENTTRRKMAQPRPPWNSHMKDSINYRLNPKDQVKKKVQRRIPVNGVKIKTMIKKKKKRSGENDPSVTTEGSADILADVTELINNVNNGDDLMEDQSFRSIDFDEELRRFLIQQVKTTAAVPSTTVVGGKKNKKNEVQLQMGKENNNGDDEATQMKYKSMIERISECTSTFNPSRSDGLSKDDPKQVYDITQGCISAIETLVHQVNELSIALTRETQKRLELEQSIFTIQKELVYRQSETQELQLQMNQFLVSREGQDLPPQKEDIEELLHEKMDTKGPVQDVVGCNREFPGDPENDKTLEQDDEHPRPAFRVSRSEMLLTKTQKGDDFDFKQQMESHLSQSESQFQRLNEKVQRVFPSAIDSSGTHPLSMKVLPQLKPHSDASKTVGSQMSPMMMYAQMCDTTSSLSINHPEWYRPTQY